MQELMMLKIGVMEKWSKELKEYVMKIEEKSPHWYVLTRRAKYEFMNKVFLELPNFIFSKEECKAILELGNYLEICWNMWNQKGETIQNTMESAVEAMLVIHCDGINEDEDVENDKKDEGNWFAVFIS